MKFRLFYPTDFDPGGPPADDGKDLCTYIWAANMANKKLDEWLMKQQTVYGHSKAGAPTPVYWGPHELNNFEDTHEAKIVCIKPFDAEESRECSMKREFREVICTGPMSEMLERVDKLVEKYLR